MGGATGAGANGAVENREFCLEGGVFSGEVVGLSPLQGERDEGDERGCGCNFDFLACSESGERKQCDWWSAGHRRRGDGLWRKCRERHSTCGFHGGGTPAEHFPQPLGRTGSAFPRSGFLHPVDYCDLSKAMSFKMVCDQNLAVALR